MAGDAERHWKSVEVSSVRQNVLYVVIDDRIPLVHKRMIVGGNPIRDIPFTLPLPSSHCRVSISGRSAWSKGHFSALEACALASSQRGLSIMVVGSTSMPISQAAKRTLEVAGVPWVWADAIPWAEYPAWIRWCVDVTLQPTVTESFGLVALEHLLVGRPCVGSPALRFLPHDWQADADDIHDIAKQLDTLLCTPVAENAARAREIGEAAARESEARFAAMADRFLRFMEEVAA